MVDNTGIKLLNLMFFPEESACVSINQYGYHSISMEEILTKDFVGLLPPTKDNESSDDWLKRKTMVPTKDLIFIALNPIQGQRSDANCYKYRNFMIEIDTGELKAQKEYILSQGIPYSAIIFSGNKSLHTLVSLDEDLKDENHYRLLSEWTLNIMTACDQNTKNPSRSLRLAGSIRPDTGKKQVLVEFKGKIKLSDYMDWLEKHPESKPKPIEKMKPSGNPDYRLVKPWVKLALHNKTHKIWDQGRNRGWFSLACEYSLAGYDIDNVLDIMSNHFEPDKDFNHKEWKRTIESAFKSVRSRV